MTQFKQDEQIIKKPKCAIPECNNPALLYCSGEWICGECMKRYNDNMNKMIFENMKEMLK